VMANQTDSAVRMAMQLGFGHPELRALVRRGATIRTTTTRTAPRAVPQVMKTPAQWAAHFAAMFKAVPESEIQPVPPPPSFNDAVRRRYGTTTQTPTRSGRLTDTAPPAPDLNAAVRAHHKENAQ
jgi:hypothetical protein